MEKCKRKMKCLVDKYKECKDWNQKQSGGSIWKSLHYDEVDAVLGVRDLLMFSNVAGAGSESSNTSNTTSQEESSSGTPSPSPSPSPANTSSSSVESEKESRRMRKKEDPTDPWYRKRNRKSHEEMEKMQEAQAKQWIWWPNLWGPCLKF